MRKILSHFFLGAVMAVLIFPGVVLGAGKCQSNGYDGTNVCNGFGTDIDKCDANNVCLFKNGTCGFLGKTEVDDICATKGLLEDSCGLIREYKTGAGGVICTWVQTPDPTAPASPNGAGAAPPAGPTGPTEISGQNGITASYLKDKYENSEALKDYKGPIPKCAFSGTCRSTNDLLILLINVGKYLFSIIGMVALVAFIYGGFMMIFSFGNAEKVKAGRDAMVAAVVGLVIAFSAYLIINFVLDALEVEEAFRGLLK